METQLVLTVLIVILTGITAVLAAFAKSISAKVNAYLDAVLNGEDFTLLKAGVDTIVKMLMQSTLYKDLTGPEKKQIAMAKIQEYLRLAGVMVTTHEIDDLIEACVAEFKKGQFPALLSGKAA